MTTPAVAPYVPYYASRSPYLTRAEFMAAPTGVDLTQLIPGGTPEANGAALDTVLASASNYADVLCRQVLAATVDMQAGEYRVFPDGTIRVPIANTPILEVTGVSVGWQAGALTAMTDLSGLWISRKVVRIPVWGVASLPGTTGVPATPSSRGRVFAEVTYVNGYANTTLAADVLAGASSIVVASALGVFAGMPLTIYDDAAATTESATVDASYVLGSTTVPLTAPLTSAHNTGVAVSALPRAVKQAVVCLAAHVIKTRGAEAIALQTMSGGPAQLQQSSPGYSEEYQQAVDLLRPFARVA